MGNNVKVLIGEINGQELDQQEEYNLQFDDLPTVDVSTVAPTTGDHLEWDGNNWVPAAPSLNGAPATAKFGSNSTATTGKWLEIHRNITSNDSPFIAYTAMKISGFSASTSTVSTLTLGIFKNGTQIDTLVFTATDKKSKSGLSHSLAVDDEVSVKVISGSGTDIVMHVFFE